MYSMTGYGKGVYESDNYTIEVEIKTLNSKNLDIRLKNGFLNGEQELHIRNYLVSKIIRGKVDVFIKIEDKVKQGKYSIRPEIFDKYYNQFKQITDNYGKKIDKVDYFGIIMRLPEIIEASEQTVEDKWDGIISAMEQAVENLEKFRLQEGEATKKLLISYIESISANLTKVADYEEERIKTVRQRIMQAFSDAELKADSERLEAELIYYLEKYDIQEEKNRLANHLKYFVSTLEEPQCGRKLGFISQEMGREINTLGSKANHFEIQKLVVKMKDDLEKIKEQVLNIL